MTQDSVKQRASPRGHLAGLRVPNLLAINFVVKGPLGDGVVASPRSEPQAKSLGEYLRAELVAIPISLLETQLAAGGRLSASE